MIQLQVPADARMIELGGGNNPMVLPRCRGGNALNVDVRQAYGPDGQPCVDLVADFNEPLPIQDGEWDIVLSKFSIEHLSWRKVRQFIGELFRIMKPGGKAVVITANTEKQLEVVKKRIAGDVSALPDKADDDFSAYSCILFGDNDYPENCHRNFLSPSLAQDLFGGAGFYPVQIAPYGDLQTDMLIEAVKPNPKTYSPLKMAHDQIEAVKPKEEKPTQAIVMEGPLKGKIVTDNGNGLFVPPPPPKQETTHPEWYGHDYFDRGELMGGYRGGYRDFPSNEVALIHFLTRKPESVLELGCGRGNIVRRLQNRGIRACGMELSRHAWLTRTAEGVIEFDCTKAPWPWKDQEFDCVFSLNFFDHVPECLLPTVVGEMKRVAKRGLHGIDFGPIHDGDRTRFISEGREWWESKLPKEHEVKSSIELESGDFPKDVLEGDGRLKLNLGSHIVQFHHGWQNIDVHDLAGYAQANGYRYLHHDIRQGLPMFHTGVVDLIYSSHCLEHLSYAEGLTLLRECRRVLRPMTGAMRIVVPDAELLTNVDFDLNSWTDFNEINVECEQARTPMAKLHAMLYSGDHKALYDAETLIHMCEEAGFEAKQDVFRGSLDHTHEGSRQIQRECMDTLQPISLYINAIPKVG